MATPNLDRLVLAADGLEAAHAKLMRECPWYAKVSAGEAVGDPGEHCKAASGKGEPPRLVVKLTPRTAEASTVVKPTVPPGGPGLFHIKGRNLPPYMEHLWFHLVKEYGKHRAYQVANGIVQKWAKGIAPGCKKKDGSPCHTHADVQAAAGKNVAEWEKDRSDAHTQSSRHVRASASLPAETLETERGPYKAASSSDKETGLAHEVEEMGQNLTHAKLHALALKRKQDDASCTFNCDHAERHLDAAMLNTRNFLAHLRDHFPREGRELDQLVQVRKGMKVALARDANNVATTPHLADTVGENLAHARAHLDSYRKAKDDASRQFNHWHVMRHINVAEEHVGKLAAHVGAKYPKARKALEDLASLRGAMGLARDDGPTMSKDEAGYKPDGGKPGHRCGDCTMIHGDHCTLVKGTVDAETGVCKEFEAKKKSAQLKLSDGGGTITAPGASHDVIPAPTGGKYSQYGLHQKPSQTVSPSPPLPPEVKAPTPEEVRRLIPDVPECADVTLSNTVKKFLEAAAVKLEKNSELDALAVFRSLSAAILSAHKADLGQVLPAFYTAGVFSRIPPAEQSSAGQAVLEGVKRREQWRKLEIATQAMADRIRKRFFHGHYNGPSMMNRI